MHTHTEYKANKNATKFRPRQVACVFLRREGGSSGVMLVVWVVWVVLVMLPLLVV